MLLILLCFSQEAKSTHILGGHISYECLGGDEYSFTLSVYSDCFGQQANPVPDNLIFFTPDGSCAGLTTIANLALLSSTQEISELCDEELLDSSCLPGGFSPGTILTTYTVTQTLDPSCTWTASWAFDDYNFFINADFPVFDDAYFSATVDPLMGCNSTIVIDGTQQVPYGLVGELFSHQLVYTSTPGNTVNFSIGVPQVENNQLNFDIPGYDPSTITVSPTGLVEFTPPTAGNYVTNVIIEEYDPMGILLYTMTETMTFVSRISISGEPEFTDGGGIENDGGTFISPTSYEVCEGDSICITFEAIHPDPFSIMEITSNISTLFPGASIDSIACPFIVPGVNAICSEVCWLAQPTANIEFSVYVIDNDCDLPAVDTVDVQLILTAGTFLTLLNTDSTLCEGNPVDLDIITSGIPDFVFEYSTEEIGSGVIDTLTIDPLGVGPITLNPLDDTEYCMVSLTDSEGCQATIDIASSCFVIAVNPELSVTGFGNDTTLCVGEEIIVDLGLAGTAPFTVDYTVTNVESGVTSAEQTEVLALGETWTLSPITSSVFSITSITDGAPIYPCVLLVPDEITVTVNAFTSISVTTDSIACLGDLVPVNFSFENFLGPNFDVTYTTQTGAGAPLASTILDIPINELTPDSLYSFLGIPGGITDDTTFEITEIIDDGNECVSIDNTPATVLLAPEVVLTFLDDGTICSGDSLLTTISVTGDGPWSVSIDTPNSTEEIEISASPVDYYTQDEGSYIITSVEDNYECAGTIIGEVELTLLDLPLANLDGESNICSGETTEVPLNITSTSPLYFEILDPNNTIIEDSVGFFIGDSTFTVSIPGIYTLQTVTNSDGCINDTITSFHTITETLLASLTLLNTDSTLCEGNPVDLDIITSGIPDFVFEYSTEEIGSGVIDTLTIDPLGVGPITLNPLDDTEYCMVSLTDSEGCQATIDIASSCFVIAVNPELSVTGFGNDTTLCVGEEIIVDLGLAGTAPFTVDYTVTNVESGVTSAEQTEVLALGETWTLSPITSSVFSITSITDGAPIYPCVLLVPDEITVTVNAFTSISVTTDSIACLGDLVPVNFSFENFLGPNFDVTYTTQTGAGAPLASTILDIPINELTPDSLYSFLGIPGGITDDTTFEITEIIDDGNECVSIDNTPATVLLAPEVVLTFLDDGTICSGDSLLTTISVTGDGPWSVSIDTPNSTEEIEISASPVDYYTQDEGSYIITSVEDNYECAGTIIGEVELTLLDLPLANLDGESNICSGETTEVPLNITSTSPLYFEILDPNNTIIEDSVGFFIGDSTFTVSIPGIYTLQTVTNSDGCINDTITSFHTVIEDTTPNATLTGNNFICTDDSTQVFINITDGSAPFSYDLEEVNSGTLNPFLNTTSSDSIFVLISGEYSLINFTDNNNCSGTLNANLIITDEPLPLVDAGPDFSSCPNTEVSLGTSDDLLLNYQWTSNDSAVLDNLTGAFPPAITTVNTGMADIQLEVYLEVTNGMCFNYDTLLITVTPQPISDAGPDFTVCFDEPASLNGMGSGTITWLDNGNLDDYNTATPNVLNTQVTDTFVLQIEDIVNPGCFHLDTVIVNVNPALILDLDFSNEICSGICDGEITSSSSGGFAPLVETWTDSNGNPVLNLTNLCADNYTITVTDGIGCSIDSIITISELPEYFISDVIITNPVCFGDETGSIEVLAVNGNSFTVNSALQLLDPTFTMLPVNNYNVSVINDIGCEADTVVTLTSNPEIFLSTNFETTDICDGDNISFEVTATGGIDDYIYYWIPSIDEFDTNNNVVSFVPTNDVSVQVYATDDNGQCFTDTLAMSATFPSVIEVQVNDDITICQGEQIVLESIVSGGNGNLSCFWDVPEIGIINNCITTVEPLINTTYEVTVIDGCSLPVVASFIATVNVTPAPTFTADAINGCYPITVEFSNTTDDDLLGNCEWNFGDGNVSLPVCTDVTYTYASPGNFSPSLSVTSEDGCTGVSLNNPTITVYGYPTADFEWSPNPVNILESEVQFINLSNGATNYLWEAEGAFTATGANPYFEFEPTSLDSYNICLQAENQFGCADTICKLLVIQGVVLVHVPNAFSPDGDNLNEVFSPIALGISSENYLFQIWSREGQLIFETTQPGMPWDGSVDSGEYYSKNDVYTWVLEVQDVMTANKITYRGSVTLLR